MRSTPYIFIIIFLIFAYSCTEQPTESVRRDNTDDGNNPDFIPEITDIIISQGDGQAENPVPLQIICTGASGAIEQMMIGQVDTFGEVLNDSWQTFDSTTTLNFAGALGTKWLAAKVRALNGNESAVFYKTFNLGLNTPTSLSALVDELSIILTWRDNSSVEQGYKIERKEAGGTYILIAATALNVETYIDTELDVVTTYRYRIFAYSGSNNSSYSNEVEATTIYPAGFEQTFDLGITSETIEMVWIPPGSFMQGAYNGEVGADEYEYPQHLVILDYGFWLGKYEVTQAQWEAVTGNNPAHNYGIGVDYPVY